jgi:hypothetical protein
MSKTYSDLLKDPRWQKKRLQIMKRDKFTCKLCGDKDTPLHVHHKEYINGNTPWGYKNSQLVTICEDCHLSISNNSPGIYLSSVNFNDISTLKFKNEQGKRFIILTYPNTCIFDEHSNNGTSRYSFHSNAIPQIINQLKKAIK